MADDAPRPLTEEEIAEMRGVLDGSEPWGESCLTSQQWRNDVARLLATLDARPSGDEALRAALHALNERRGGCDHSFRKYHPSGRVRGYEDECYADALEVSAALAAPVSPSPDICEGCDGTGDACRAIWPEQRKCCPDCSHEAAPVSPSPDVETCQRLCIHVDDCPVAHGTEEPQHGD